jgi:enterochelin esterase-like enzyme
MVHDGFEYAEFADLLVLLEHLTQTDAVPAMRAALLAPVDRDEHYSASAAYGRALAHEVLPALGALAPLAPGPRMRIGLGASLGALALLHAQRAHPTTFGGLLLQSGSFFRQRFDKHEASLARFGRIARHVGRVLAAAPWAAHAIPVAMTCGTAEENLANNRATYGALARQGYDVSMYEHRDAHNWVAWRDALQPALGELLRSRWAEWHPQGT